MILFKVVDFLTTVCVAAIIALLLGYVAHYLFGLSRLDIRTAALTGAAIFAVIFVMLFVTKWIAWPRK
jgi:hypothetical protein